MKRLLTIALLAVLVAANAALASGLKWYGNPAVTLNAGIVVNDLGGVELYGEPGPFLCPSQISPLPALPALWPELVVDC